jgi:hypothetical protein
MLRDTIFRLAFSLLTIAVIIGVLKILDWVPEAFQEGFGKEYSTVQEARSKLNFEKIYVPSYFPQSLRWPPSRIMAQKRPFSAIVMEFRRVGDGAVALVIVQSDSSHDVKHQAIRIRQIRKRIPYTLGGRDAVLETGRCNDREPCGLIAWTEGDQKVMVVARSDSSELLKIAKSMLPER